jgi:hypothetical protein
MSGSFLPPACAAVSVHAAAGDCAVIKNFIVTGSMFARRIKLYQGSRHSPTFAGERPWFSGFWDMSGRRTTLAQNLELPSEKSLLSSQVYFVRIKYSLVKNFINQPGFKIRE